MSEENFCSTCLFDKFDKHITNALKDMRNEKDFSDVTLACGNEQLLAHKVILAAYSPFFRNILKQNPHPHPLIYLKGADYRDLQAILNYLYQGQVNVPQENVNSFLALAKDLEIKGLEKAYNSPDESNSDDISSGSKVYAKAQRPQASVNKKPPQESSSQTAQASSNEKTPHRSVKETPPAGQTKQKGAGVRSRSSSAEYSESPPSKSARLNAAGYRSDENYENDADDHSDFTNMKRVKQGPSYERLHPTTPPAPGSRSIPQEIQEILDIPRENESECSILSPPGSFVPSTGSVQTEDYGDDTEDIRRFQIFKSENIELTADGPMCKICSRTFPKRFNAERHLQFTHFGTDDVPCPDCGLFFKNVRSLAQHRRSGYCPIALKK